MPAKVVAGKKVKPSPESIEKGKRIMPEAAARKRVPQVDSRGTETEKHTSAARKEKMNR